MGGHYAYIFQIKYKKETEFLRETQFQSIKGRCRNMQLSVI